MDIKISYLIQSAGLSKDLLTEMLLENLNTRIEIMNKKTKRARDAETGEYSPLWKAERWPKKFVVESDYRGRKKNKTT